MAKFPGQAIRSSTSGRPVMVLLDAMGKRWTLRVVWELGKGSPCTFRELQARCEEVSPTSLNQRLKDLRELGLVGLTSQGYELTSYGRSLSELLLPLDLWASDWAKWLTQDSSQED